MPLVNGVKENKIISNQFLLIGYCSQLYIDPK
jgi:hypothetical protein